MPLSHHDQMTLLKDILNNHQVDCCGSVAECEQLERLVKSLMVNPNIHENIKPILQEVSITVKMVNILNTWISILNQIKRIYLNG